jgi:hypothetical protein
MVVDFASYMLLFNRTGLALFYRGRAYKELNERVKAKSDLQDALELLPPGDQERRNQAHRDLKELTN